jgi:hypothetical protein
MVAPLKYIVIVGEDGKVTIDRTSLRQGMEVEVTVEERPVKKFPSPAEQAAIWHELRSSLKLTREQAEQWGKDIRSERESWGP